MIGIMLGTVSQNAHLDQKEFGQITKLLNQPLSIQSVIATNRKSCGPFFPLEQMFRPLPFEALFELFWVSSFLGSSHQNHSAPPSPVT